MHSLIVVLFEEEYFKFCSLNISFHFHLFVKVEVHDCLTSDLNLVISLSCCDYGLKIIIINNILN